MGQGSGKDIVCLEPRMSQTCRQELDLGSEGLRSLVCTGTGWGEGLQGILRQLLKACLLGSFR